MALAEWLDRKLKASGVAITGVAIGIPSDKTTWKVSPASLQPQAQPIIDAFDPNDPTNVDTDLDSEVKQALDAERLISAVVWAIIDTYSAPASKAKYGTARQKIIDAYKARPWV